MTFNKPDWITDNAPATMNTLNRTEAESVWGHEVDLGPCERDGEGVFRAPGPCRGRARRSWRSGGRFFGAFDLADRIRGPGRGMHGLVRFSLAACAWHANLGRMLFGILSRYP